jgi:hypothetical protein
MAIGIGRISPRHSDPCAQQPKTSGNQLRQTGRYGSVVTTTAKFDDIRLLVIALSCCYDTGIVMMRQADLQ